MIKHIFLLTIIGLSVNVSHAYIPDNYKKKIVKNNISLRNDCAPAEEAIEMEVNNVRARLRIGGDLWWDGSNARYVVPKVAAGEEEVSAIFAGGVWLGGLDPAGNRKVAITQYPSGSTTDFYPGPLDEKGETNSSICKEWDRFFTLEGDNIRRTIARYDLDGELDCEEIPDDVKYWPGRGNPYWKEKFSFDLPDQKLGAFWDDDQNGIYSPCQGDFPIINIRNCEPQSRQEAKELVPDEMIFWIYNDAGNQHFQTQADKIQMEIQVQAFAYATNDELNDMTFIRYRLINKAVEDIRQCYFAMWVDPDLGCSDDDYIGCDIERSLAYVYNEDAVDGVVGCECSGRPTYCHSIPLIGIDYFRGPRGPKVIEVIDGDTVFVDPPFGSGELDTLIELGMSSFTYTNNCGINDPPPGTCDPENGEQAYNVLRGLWPDGRAITVGNTGYNPPENTDTTRFVFPGLPNKVDDWTMCSADAPFGDRRTIQATGPILLQAGGADEELIIGLPFVPDVSHPCPDISRLQFADDIAQALFDNCFDITDGPDAPDMFAVELDRELILTLSNDSLLINSNNAKYQYEEIDQRAPKSLPEDSIKYVFEGYKIYQLANASVSVQELDDPEKAKLIRQVDLKNDVGDIYNWYPQSNPNSVGELLFLPNLEVSGSNQGIVNSFQILNDAFDPSNGRLVNHTDYYFTVVAYGYNSYQLFDANKNVGQRSPYLEGRGNIRTYTFTPRPIAYKELRSAYGVGLNITRLDGVGTGLNSLDLVDGTIEEIITSGDKVELIYKGGRAPIHVKVIDPLNVSQGKYMLEIFSDYDDNSNEFLDNARWRLTNVETGEVVLSDFPISVPNEQIIYGKGFSVSVSQAPEPGDGELNNGGLEQEILYKDEDAIEWWGGGRASTGLPTYIDNIAANYQLPYLETFENLDPTGGLFGIDNGFFTPLGITRWRESNPYVSPNWVENFGIAMSGNTYELARLNNVDVVFTSDKSKWSRCIVVESSSNYFRNNGLPTEGNVQQFQLRAHGSVDKNGNLDGDGQGMSWFPGYAIDVETGERLNIFFGENSGFSDVVSQNEFGHDSLGIGNDMLWNPDTISFIDGELNNQLLGLFGGGHHFIYLTNTQYDECKGYRELLSGGNSILAVRDLFASLTYAAVPVLAYPLLSIEEGLIPSKVTVQVRALNQFSKELDYEVGDTDPMSIGALPTYEFSLENVSSIDMVYEEDDNPLDSVAVVPNPYYAYSSYETSQFNNTIKIVNLPAKAIITIYSLDGKFIRRLSRDESPIINEGSNPANLQNQIYPAVEWDLNNSAGIPVASGIYIFHVVAPDLGAEISIKWFGVHRQFDPTGL